MYPTFRLGALQLETYRTVYALAVILVGMIAFHRLRRPGISPEVQMRRLGLVIVGGFVGTYLIGVIPTLAQWARTGQLAWAGRASYVGTLAGGTLAALWVAPRAELPHALDRGAPPFALLQALGRIGCLGAGCCYGVPTDSWMGMYLRNEYGEWAIRFPTQIISGVANLGIFVLLLLVERYGRRRGGSGQGWPFDGFLFLLYIALFSVERFIGERLRGDAVPLLGPLSWVHLATLASLAGALALMWRGWRRARWEVQESGQEGTSLPRMEAE